MSNIHQTNIQNQRINLVIVGHVGYDTINSQHVKNESCIGGAAFYVAVGASCFTLLAAIVTRIPKNDDKLLHAIKSLSLPMEGVKRVVGSPSRFWIRHSNDISDTNSVSYDTYLGCGNTIEISDIPQSYLLAPYIHLGTAPPKQQLVWASDLRMLIGNKSTLSVDTSQFYIEKYKDEFAQVIELTDLLFVNEREFLLLIADGIMPKLTVLKQGARGAEIRVGDKVHCTAQAPRVTCLDDTGAGDVLAGAFLAMRATGLKPETALRSAVDKASLSVTQLGVQHIVQIKSSMES